MDFLTTAASSWWTWPPGARKRCTFPRRFRLHLPGGARPTWPSSTFTPRPTWSWGPAPSPPCRCRAPAWAWSPGRTGTASPIPLHLFAGMELKLSGFDFIVISGTAPNPVYLWLHDGIADVSPGFPLPRDNWEAVDALRRELGEDLVQVLLAGTGPCLSLGYWASADRVGLGRVFNDKGLRAVCTRGLGILDAADPEVFAETCVGLVSEVRDSLPAGRHGLEGSYRCSRDGNAITRLPSCTAAAPASPAPYDCNIYLKTEEDPSSMAQDGGGRTRHALDRCPRSGPDGRERPATSRRSAPAAPCRASGRLSLRRGGCRPGCLRPGPGGSRSRGLGGG